MANRMYRSRTNRVVAGVAGGMADYFGFSTFIVRVIWLFLFIPGGLPGLLPYLILWAIMPLEPRGRILD